MTLNHQRGLTEPAADAAIDQACRMLRLPTLRQQFTAIADAADREQLTYRGFLAELLMAECEDRQRRRSERRIKAAGFPRQKWLKDFDFEANPNIQPAVDLLCIDELGYMELDKRGADLLFQVLTEREEKASVAIASNESFGAWTNTFTDPRLCGAIVDRLTFNATIIDTGSDSHRMAHTRARQATEPA
ncbi:ATP-binding protein [Actinomadura welshii]|uniref:ATP-binding protein n=1 Tax=Actinomadura welshii TaxID=3103817 RepID=UPI0003AD4DBF|nr:ATP-binding protein [Actinomadura madurae]